MHESATFLWSPSVECLVIHTDSHVVWDFFHNRRRRFRQSGYSMFDNADLWRDFDQRLHEVPQTFCVKVRAHNGNHHFLIVSDVFISFEYITK